MELYRRQRIVTSTTTRTTFGLTTLGGGHVVWFPVGLSPVELTPVELTAVELTQAELIPAELLPTDRGND